MTPKVVNRPRAVARPSRASFEELVVRVPTGIFVTMVSKSGLPNAEARVLCAAFKNLRND